MFRSLRKAVAGSSVLLTSLTPLPTWAAENLARTARGAPNSIMLYSGFGTDVNFTQSVYAPWSIEPNGLGFVGIAASEQLGTINDFCHDWGFDLGATGDDFTLEGEIGGGYRFGEETMAEAWTALYLRYDGLPWNNIVYTTIAADLGIDVLSEKSDIEASREADSEGRGANASYVLHFFSPEITIADPDNKNVELVLRLQHRSGVFGLIDGITSGSTIITTGIRVRF
jgi:hypothetical protein